VEWLGCALHGEPVRPGRWPGRLRRQPRDGRVEIEALLTPIFKDHPTARFIAKVREVRMLGTDTAFLRAVAGMVPPGKRDLMPERNAIQTLDATRTAARVWKVEMFHNTPAKFDGRPELAEQLTAELREVLSKE
jgi:uncharacterized protein (TIGR02246 family)